MKMGEVVRASRPLPGNRRTRRSCHFVVILAALLITSFACKEKPQEHASEKIFERDKVHALNYENVSALLQDMQAFAQAVRKLDQETIRKIDKQYEGVRFETIQKPLFLNQYAAENGKQAVFLLTPKSPDTGSNYLVKYEKPLPVVDADVLELQFRHRNPENPLACVLPVEDAAAYMEEHQSHEMKARYVLRKPFYQSGTYDFDALQYPSYRTRGYPFITFDVIEAELIDQTTNQKTICREQ